LLPRSGAEPCFDERELDGAVWPRTRFGESVRGWHHRWAYLKETPTEEAAGERTGKLGDRLAPGDEIGRSKFDSAGPDGGQSTAEPVDLAVLAAQTADRFAAVAEAGHQSLAVRAGAATDGSIVTVPPEWLDRLLGVLLDNACKYSPEGGGVIVSVTAQGRRVRLAVDDSGPGIPVEERGRVFDRFHRATDAPGGAGLGLAIADAIVRASSGRWHIGTSAAGGASVSVSWTRSMGGAGGRRESDSAE
jgi:signal transduction histidine kinase